ncbi:recombinase family protein [bacterium]|nr:recombinase family protein [bacterium]
MNHIASYLTTSEVPTKNGGRWQSNTVNRILNREI